MRIKWLGHAAFLITSEKGLRIITDPYSPAFGGIRYKRIDEEADIVLVSHDHGDHNAVSDVRGKPVVVRGPGYHRIRDIEIKGIESFHDDAKGKSRGPNTIFCFAVDEIKICHLGDLGHLLSPDQVRDIGEVNVLLIPVGGFFTIGPTEATHVVEALRPNIVIPMHFKTPKCDFPISGVDEFLKGKERVRREKRSEMEITKEALPEPVEIIVLEHAN